MGQGTVLSDLLEYTQKLIKKGGGSTSAHKLQAVIQGSSPVKSEPQPDKLSYMPLVMAE